VAYFLGHPVENVKTAANIYHFQACNSLETNGVISVRAD